jgi:nicotinate-nucleotide adenylyltransferase
VKSSKIGILGGTFDPVHNGHLTIASEVKEKLGLKKVLFIPAGQPWQKSYRKITPTGQRVKMVELAIAQVPEFELSYIEVDRPGSTYTVDTMAELSKKYDSEELYFIIGWDALLGAPYWKEPEKIIKLCYVVTVPRPGITPPYVAELDKVIPGIAERLIMLESPLVDISSSDIRERVAKGRPYADLVPKEVADYIKSNGLYRN